MAGSNEKRCKRKGNPKAEPKAQKKLSLGPSRLGDPDSIMALHPSWSFSDCDTDECCDWALYKSRLTDTFWDFILPKLCAFESMTWSKILIEAKKQNHSISLEKLNKVAKDRLADLQIEAEDIYSLRLSGKIRLYGFLVGPAYHIIWYDEDHGDNDTCVCRSSLKGT